ncbi:hypothetical protein DVH05_020049 [Phytophthora capsici]|nr:hypothetical protein DVH05_020049 [Phytophthora capsici]
MGNTRSYSRSSSFEIKDALALCEDGDLLLAREKLADCTLRVGVEFVVARDIQRMQRGQFPTQRMTSLPLGAAGLQFVSFDERVASKMPNTRDCFAIRRLQHDARTEHLSSVLRDLAIQIASVAPISWHALLIRSLPSLVQRLVKRMLELFHDGLKMDESGAANDQRATEQSLPLSTNSDDNSTLQTLGFAGVTARLSAAFIAAVYECVNLVDPVRADRSEPVLPASFWSSNSNNRLILSPPTALGPEVLLNRSK